MEQQTIQEDKKEIFFLSWDMSYFVFQDWKLYKPKCPGNRVGTFLKEDKKIVIRKLLDEMPDMYDYKNKEQILIENGY